MEQRVKLCLNQAETDNVEIGCCMSPILLNLYGEYLMKAALAEVGDFRIGGRIINKVRFMDFWNIKWFQWTHGLIVPGLCQQNHHKDFLNSFSFCG